MPTTPHLICFLGRNGSGKSFRAKELVEKQGYTKVSMADPMRELAWKTLGWRPETDEEYNFFKTAEIWSSVDWEFSEDVWNKKKIEEPNVIQYNTKISRHKTTGRQFLQNIGEACKEMFGQDFWVEQWRKKVLEKQHCKIGRFKVPLSKNNDEMPGSYYLLENAEILLEKITTDDIRFPQEVEAANDLGATFIWCDYQKGNYPEDNHQSETLANRILASGKYKDGDEIPFEELQMFF